MDEPQAAPRTVPWLDRIRRGLAESGLVLRVAVAWLLLS